MSMRSLSILVDKYYKNDHVGECSMFKICRSQRCDQNLGAKLKSVVSNLLGTRDQSREKMFEGHSINNTCVFHSCIIIDNTLSAIVPKLVR